MKHKALIAMPSGSGLIPTQVVQSLLQLKKPMSCGFLTVDRLRVDIARNFLVKMAIEQDCDYLLFIDDDNPVPPDAFEKLYEADKDVIIAPIVGRHATKDGKRFLCALYKEDVDVKGETIRMYHPIEEFRDEGPLHQIDAGGTGCMLIKRKVFETLYNKYEGQPFEFGDITVNGQRRTMSEDAEFCERAVDEGFEIWLHDEVRPFHLGNQEMIQWKP